MTISKDDEREAQAILPPRAKDLTGQRFGRWLCVEYAGTRCSSSKSRPYTVWRVRCDCSQERVVSASALVRGRSQSCGCRPNVSAFPPQHGGTGTPLHRVWLNMIARCVNPNRHNYRDYGGRGIRVCDRWLNDFAAFREDMGSEYRKGLTLDRINNDGPYSPDNCRWATASAQQRNKRTNRIIKTPAGDMILRAAAEHSGIAEDALRYRVRRKWPVERLFDPVRQSRPPGSRIVHLREVEADQ